ncbi:hypothetical protein BS78_07G134700 [Paspalum vaginatum]|nr:hypothetical protein BS78_07G134700 [Paspalum vaginatum]
MLRGLRVPTLPATTRPPRRRLLSAAAAAALFHLVVDIVLYAYLAVAWAHSLGGIAVEILGRWVYGKGSAAESVGAACWIVLGRFFLAVAPLFVMRLFERFKYEEEKERREKASTEQLPESNEAQLRLPKGFSLVPISMSSHLCQLLHLAILMKHSEGEGSRLRTMESLLYDVACFGLAVNAGFLLQNIAIMVTVPKVQETNGMMQ